MAKFRPNPRIQQVSKRVTSDVVTTSNVASNVTGMSFDIGANEVWSYEFWLQTGCDNTGGMKMNMSVPSGATHKTVVFGISGSSTAFVSSIITGSNQSTANNTIGSSNGWIRVAGTVVGGATAGTVQLQFASSTNTQTSTVFANSFMNARKIN